MGMIIYVLLGYFKLRQDMLKYSAKYTEHLINVFFTIINVVFNIRAVVNKFLFINNQL